MSACRRRRRDVRVTGALPTPFSGGSGPRAGDVSFRHALRHDTSVDHERVEAAFAPLFDHADRNLDGFLAAQWRALDSLRRTMVAGSARGIESLIDGLLEDLRGDGAASVPAEGAAGMRLDPLAVAYVVVGSRLGAEVLRRRLGQEGARTLPRFFDARDVNAEWAAVCGALAAIAPGSADAARIVGDVRLAYGCFIEAAGEEAARRPVFALDTEIALDKDRP